MDELRLRALDELLAAERQFRQQAEGRVRALNAVLTELAYRLGGEKLELLRKQDTHAPQSWTPETWRAFFQALTLDPSAGWGSEKKNGNGNGYHVEIERLTQEVERLKKELSDTQTELWRERKKAAEIRTYETEIQKEKAVTHTSTAVPENYAYKHIPIMGWQTPVIPAAFAARLQSGASTRRDAQLNERRRMMALWLLSVSGIAAQIELTRLIAAREGVSPEAGSIKRPIESLAENSLIISQTLSINLGNTPSRLVVLRLSEDGKTLCKLWGYPIAENEWERLIHLHEGDRQEDHTMAILLFTAHARIRGWKATVLPELDNAARPDVLIENESGERWYVEVETGRREHENNAKWRNLADLQDGKIALCARTQEDRKALVADCQHWHGIATDLESLVLNKLKNIKPGDDLWTQRW